MARGAAVFFGKKLGILDARQALPVLQHLVEPEPGRTQGRGCFLSKRGRERQHDWFLAFVAGAGFAGEGPAAEGGPLFYLLGVARPVAQRQQRAIKGVGIEIEQAGFLDQTAGFDQTAGAGLAPGVLELGFLFGKPGFLLFMSTKALSKRTGHPSPIQIFTRPESIVVRHQGNPQRETFRRRSIPTNSTECI